MDTETKIRHAQALNLAVETCLNRCQGYGEEVFKEEVRKWHLWYFNALTKLQTTEIQVGNAKLQELADNAKMGKPSLLADYEKAVEENPDAGRIINEAKKEGNRKRYAENKIKMATDNLK